MTVEEHRRLFAEIASREYPYPRERFAGTGVVVCAGGDTYLTCAYVCVRMLRDSGCLLPVELWYLGDGELGPAWREILSRLEIKLVDATEVARLHPARILRGWEVKAFSVIHSAFRHVLLLDADNVVAVNPTYLFEAPQYLETGAVFWPDRGRLGADHPIWQITGVPYRDEPEFESGQMLIDKEQSWRALQVTKHMNDYSDFYYRQFHGDKETFHFGWRASNTSYAMGPAAVDVQWRALYQHDFSGRRAFQHRSGAKWSLGDNLPVPDFRHEDRCLAHLEDLRAELTRINIGNLGAPGAALYRQVVAQRRYLYIRAARDHRVMDFLPAGHIGQGRMDLERGWHVVEEDGIPRLYLTGAQGATARFSTHPDGFLAGRWLLHERCPCILEPI